MEIERNNIRKPYLGGTHHRITGKEYHHASAQTIPPQRPDKGTVRYCRDTQTIESRHRVIQTTNEQSTQMSKPGYYVSTENDRLLTPKPYQTAEERFEILTQKVKNLKSSFPCKTKYNFRRLLSKNTFAVGWPSVM